VPPQYSLAVAPALMQISMRNITTSKMNELVGVLRERERERERLTITSSNQKP